MKKTSKIKSFVGLLFFFTPGCVFAASNNPSLGDLSDSIFGVGMEVRDIVRTVCIIAGVSLILGSLLQYKKYRQNPVETRLGAVIFTFVTGVSLILLSFAPVQI